MALKGMVPELLTFKEAGTPQIQVESWSNSARILQVRGFCKDGTISHDHTTSANRSLVTTTFDVPDVPLMLQVSPAVAGVRRGECYVRLTLLMGGFPVGRLSSAYVTDSKNISWPPGVFEGFTEGPGLLRSVTGTNPAAGANIAESVPTNARWKIRSLKFRFITDATVATRIVNIRFEDGTSKFVHIPPGTTQTASLTYDYSAYHIGEYSTDAKSDIQINLPPDIILLQAWGLETNTVNLQAGDDYGAPIMMVEEWIEE